MNDEDVGRERLAESDLRNRARTVITSCGSVCVMSLRALEYTAFSMCSRRDNTTESVCRLLAIMPMRT